MDFTLIECVQAVGVDGFAPFLGVEINGLRVGIGIFNNREP